MKAFIAHVGSPGNIDIGYTVTRLRHVDELLNGLPPGAPERRYFESDPVFKKAFPDGTFNCWGVPSRAKPSFDRTQVGDLVLMLPSIGVNGGVEQLGVVEAVCRVECWEASRILWPDTPDARLFPYLFFFRTRVGFRTWADFLTDMGYSPDWNPRGYYRSIGKSRLMPHGGALGYLRFLQGQCGFRSL